MIVFNVFEIFGGHKKGVPGRSRRGPFCVPVVSRALRRKRFSIARVDDVQVVVSAPDMLLADSKTGSRRGS